MKTTLGGVFMALLLTGCQLTAPEARLIDLPKLQESALGTNLSLSAQVKEWKVGEVADVYLDERVGTVTAGGKMTVSSSATPTSLGEPVKALLNAQADETCDLNNVQVSDAAARLALFSVLKLRKAGTGNATRLVWALSPVPIPAVSRNQWTSWFDQAKGQSGDSGHSIGLVYADRDVLVKGQRSCRRSWGTWSGQQSDAINVQLRKGWNEVVWQSSTHYQRTYNAAGQEVKATSETDFVVRGPNQSDALPWTRNADPLY